MSRNYVGRWVGNWFWPLNIAKFWLTAFDRTDIMAQTFADNLFDRTTTGVDLRFADLNPSRPNLVLNATIGSRSYDEKDRAKLFGTVFTFTHEDFAAKLNSEIASYELARAVMASASFPAAFNYMTLGDLHEPPGCPDHGDACYVHVFDGGNSDNLGLISIKRATLCSRPTGSGSWRTSLRAPSLPTKRSSSVTTTTCQATPAWRVPGGWGQGSVSLRRR